ncbi:MAG: alpha-ribazole phosphatase family protein [Thiohalomonadaceae bacterium]
MTIIIDLMRHGEPVGGHRYRGHRDDPLSERGWRQMREAVGEHCPWDLIVSSPLQRCAAFAEELRIRHDLPVELEPRFREIGFGAWEGRTRAELEAENPGCLQHFYSDPVRHTPPGAEPLLAFQERVTTAFDALLSRHEGRHVLLIGHAGLMRMIIGHTMAIPLDRIFRIQVDNACLTRLRVDDGQAALIFHAGRL